MSESSERVTRVAQFLTGILLMAAASPLEFLAAVLAGGGHGSPFGYRPVEAVFGIAWLGVPVLLFLLGLALVRAGVTGRRRLAAGIALLIPLDAAIAATALWLAEQPQPPVIMAPPDPKAVVPAAPGPMGQPAIAVAACYPGLRCTTPPPSHVDRAGPIEADQR